MKKTLALALVAAMAISVASMTAFADVSYTDGSNGADIEKATATVTLSADEYNALEATVALADLGVTNKTDWNTATKTLTGWDKTGGEGTTPLENVAKTDFVADGGNYKLVLKSCWSKTDDDEQIAKNLEAIEKNKNGAADAKTEEERMKELDKKYNADGKNGYDKTTKEDKELKGQATLKKIAEKNAQDYAWHAIQVAGVTDDTTKTWVYDVTLPDGTALYAGKTARTTLTIDGVKGDLSKFGVKVYHIEGWCKAVPVKNVDVKGNTVTFWASDFSPYVVTIGDGVASTGAADASNPSTGDFSAVPVALLAAAALGATGFVAYKKRKAE